MKDIEANLNKIEQIQPASKQLQLKGIEATKAFARLCIDENTFNTILQIFNDVYSDIVSKIKSALNDNKPEEARKLLHTLEGAAANINADGVQLATYELREAIKTGEENLKPLIDHLENQLKIVLTSIRSLKESSMENLNEQR